MSLFRNAGIWVLIFKLGPKIIPLALKLGKSVFSLTSVSLAASAAAYSYLWSWQVGVGFTAFLFIHEYGHVWAMRRLGMPVRGMYFIPLLGAVAVPERAFAGAREEIITAIMGPLFGCFFIVPAVAAFYLTQNPIFAGIAILAAFVNLLNLFPVYPLDGGRVVKALTFSLHSTFAFFVLVLSFFLAVAVSFYLSWFLLLVLALVGFMETMMHFRVSSLRPLFRAFVRAIGLSGAVFFAWIMLNDDSWTGWLSMVLAALFACALMLDLLREMIKWRIFSFSALVRFVVLVPLFPIAYSILLVINAWEGIRGVWAFRISEIQRPENYAPMNRQAVVLHGVSYLATAAAMIGFILLLRSVPGLEFVSQLLE